MSEEWRDAPGFAGLYEVSNEGRVRSLSRRIRTAHGATKMHQGQLMTPVRNVDGYLRIIFRVDGEHHSRSVHRLVCEAFNGAPGVLKTCVDHIDGDRANARAANLRWVTHAENMAFGDRRGEKNGFAKLSAPAVLEIRAGRRRGAALDLALRFGVSRCTIYDVWSGKRWRHVA